MWLCFPELPDTHCENCLRHQVKAVKTGQMCVYAIENSRSELCEFLPKDSNVDIQNRRVGVYTVGHRPVREAPAYISR